MSSTSSSSSTATFYHSFDEEDPLLIITDISRVQSLDSYHSILRQSDNNDETDQQLPQQPNDHKNPTFHHPSQSTIDPLLVFTLRPIINNNSDGVVVSSLKGDNDDDIKEEEMPNFPNVFNLRRSVSASNLSSNNNNNNVDHNNVISNRTMKMSPVKGNEGGNGGGRGGGGGSRWKNIGLHRKGSLSTNDLPTTTLSISSPYQASHSQFRGRTSNDSYERGGGGGGGGAFGPAAGAKFLASQEAQKAMKRAAAAVGGSGNEGEDEEEFSIRERLAREEEEEGRGMGNRNDDSTISKKGSGAGGGGSRALSKAPSSSPIRRVPVPRIERDTREEVERQDQREEPVVVDGTSPLNLLRRDPILNAVVDAPSSTSPSPLELSSLHKNSKRDVPILSSSKRAPPVSGLNNISKSPISSSDPILNSLGLNLNSTVPGGSSNSTPMNRKRTGSTDSTSSVTKDSVLSQLGEAIKKEKRKAELFEGECEKAKLELKEIDHNLRVLREKFGTLHDQQSLTIRNLRDEILEIESQLETAADLDEQSAQEYLDLLSNNSRSTFEKSGSLVNTFAPTLLRSTSDNYHRDTPATPTNRNPSKLSALSLKRGFTLGRRIATHVEAHDTVGSRINTPRPPLRSVSTPLVKATKMNDILPFDSSSSRPVPRFRKLSKSRRPSQGQVERTTSPIRVDEPIGRKFSAPPPPQSSRTRRLSIHRSNPPPPPPPEPLNIFNVSTEDKPPPPVIHDPVRSTTSKKPPPVSGVSYSNRQRGIEGGGGGQGFSLTTTEESDLDRGYVRQEASSPIGIKGRVRKRSNSFKNGFAGTMRVLFPSNAPKATNEDLVVSSGSNSTWLKSA